MVLWMLSSASCSFFIKFIKAGKKFNENGDKSKIFDFINGLYHSSQKARWGEDYLILILPRPESCLVFVKRKNFLLADR
ncbi:hypothetical protein DDV21_005765 [Streptococcus chenjunshii]|uniref:Uncharacterized protein n=1 Tax=Streptococcus chenjunshii TaxID=2173853 RepID=A0A372KPB4_9STRE|nr:hypothetical protein DDV21_005765 [Streptococcus chenjunshii]RFU51917.1 hypothetical protein DDV22_00280 [Streptococcus chenjunshii]RFU54109.1 hypothetical protein DDV23_00835 [Streptococcus chenjunshii]